MRDSYEVTPYDDAIECECFMSDDYCVCTEGCECGCPNCDCTEWDEKMLVGGCACGGNCMCNEEVVEATKED